VVELSVFAFEKTFKLILNFGIELMTLS